MSATDQSFRPSELALNEIELRLVPDLKPTALHRLAQADGGVLVIGLRCVRPLVYGDILKHLADGIHAERLLQGRTHDQIVALANAAHIIQDFRVSTAHQLDYAAVLALPK